MDEEKVDDWDTTIVLKIKHGKLGLVMAMFEYEMIVMKAKWPEIFREIHISEYKQEG